MKTIRQSIANPLRTDSPRYGERWRDRSTVGAGVIVNQVALSYNAFNRLTEDAQSHSGVVTGSTPKVGYSYANGAGNTTRRLTITYPSGRIVTMSYGTANSAEDRLRRLAGVSLTGEVACHHSIPGSQELQILGYAIAKSDLE
jgi:hypothetical protein